MTARQQSALSTVALLVSLLLFWFGERANDGMARWVVSGLAVAIFLVGSLGLGIRRVAAASGERRAAVKRLLVSYLLCGVALLLYAAQTDELALVADGAIRDVLRVLAPAFLLSGLLPAIAVELSLRSAGDAPEVEGWRVRFAERSARIVVLGMVTFAGINFAASKWDRKIDLSYFKTSQVGTSNQKLIETLTEELRIVLFFPPGNEVLEHTRAYVDELAGQSSHVKVVLADQALDPALARELKVRSNGYLVLAYGDKNETLRLGLDIEAASSTLRKLDEDIHERLIQVLRPPRVAYLTTGHLERDYAPPVDDKRRGLSDFKQVLQTMGFKLKRLGLGDGLGSELPDDATVVIVAGPLEPFLPAERDALRRYLDGGGRAMFFFDPDQGITGDDLLEPLGLQISRSLVATDNLRHQWRVEGERESPYNITTNNASSHPSIATLSKSAGRLATLLAGAGHVSKTEQPPSDVKATFTLRTMGGSYLDADDNGTPGESEKRSTYDLAAAVEKPGKGEDAEPMRAIVFGDTDFIGNLIIRNQGNYAVILDAMTWLAGDEDIAGTVESEKDVRLTHRKDEDRLWFYGSSVLMPASVLVLGLLYTRMTRSSTRARRGARAEGDRK